MSMLRNVEMEPGDFYGRLGRFTPDPDATGDGFVKGGTGLGNLGNPLIQTAVTETATVDVPITSTGTGATATGNTTGSTTSTTSTGTVAPPDTTMTVSMLLAQYGPWIVAAFLALWMFGGKGGKLF